MGRDKAREKQRRKKLYKDVRAHLFLARLCR